MSTKARRRQPRSAPIEIPPPAAAAHASRPGIRFRLDFQDGCSVGIGKITLLEAIARTGSLSQGARDIGMSYRRAWLLVDNMNAEFDTPVISATVGGSGGGGARLTAFGRELIRAYRSLEARIAPLAAEQMSEVATHVAGPRRAAKPSRRQKLSAPLT
jgi:molybdate transport system regulatory protein